MSISSSFDKLPVVLRLVLIFLAGALGASILLLVILMFEGII